MSRKNGKKNEKSGDERKRVEVIAEEEGVLLSQGENRIFVSYDSLPRLLATLLEAALGARILEDVG